MNHYYKGATFSVKVVICLHIGPPINVLSEEKRFPLLAYIVGIYETGEGFQS